MRIRSSIGFFYFVFVCTIANAWTEDDTRIEAEQVTLWEGKLELSRNMRPSEKLDFLGLGLRNMGFRANHEPHSEKVEGIYRKIQQELVAIPGHAQYFAEKIEKLRESKDTTSGYFAYEENRLSCIRDTLGYLPSPETVRVLGSYLDDEKDTPGPPIPSQDWTGSPSNCYIAAGAFLNLGIKNFPSDKKYINGPPEGKALLDEIRGWWAEVQSGKRTFSFIGQNEKYRFKPDGTWDTLVVENSPREEARPTKRPPLTKNMIENQLFVGDWRWIAASVLIVIFVLCWSILLKPRRSV